jgi:hypothetical protein
MVQFFRGSPDPRSELVGQLGSALGMGIGNALTTYKANEALDSVLNDKSNADLPLSEKMSKLESAMRPFGETGQRFLQQRVAIEQQAEQEKQQKAQIQQQKKQSAVFGKLLNGQPVSEKEMSELSPEQSLAWAKHQAAVNKPNKLAISQQPIEQDQLDKIKKVRDMPEYQSASSSKKYQMLTENGVSSPLAKAEADVASEEAKLTEKRGTREDAAFDRSYEAQKPFIDATTKSYQAFETDTKPKLLQMQNIPDEDIVTPTKAVFLEALGIPLGALEKPGSELYNKLSLDLLKGLPETYGNRIMKVEVDNFLKTIPTLLNSPDGRRMIASNILKLGEMREVMYNEMRRQQVDNLDTGNKFPKDFQQRVFDQVKPQIDRINNEFVKMSEVTSVPKGTKPFFSPSGNIEFVPDKDVDWAAKNGGRRIW